MLCEGGCWLLTCLSVMPSAHSHPHRLCHCTMCSLRQTITKTLKMCKVFRYSSFPRPHTLILALHAESKENPLLSLHLSPYLPLSLSLSPSPSSPPSYLVMELMNSDVFKTLKGQKLSNDHVEFQTYQILRGLKVGNIKYTYNVYTQQERMIKRIMRS